jgi:hypothetical protein
MASVVLLSESAVDGSLELTRIGTGEAMTAIVNRVRIATVLLMVGIRSAPR